MIDYITDYKACTGCSACSSICPKQCISMDRDELGFLHPSIDSKKCIECKLCSQTCPVNQTQVVKTGFPECWGVYNKNEVERKSSSSGGVFVLLADYIIRQGGTVFGACFSNDYLSVVHVGSDSMDIVHNMMRSKYVQSEIGDCFIQTKRLLIQNKPVLFTGTPCQIAGLKSFLKKDYPNLYTQDIICHGVPSPEIWKRYINEKVKKQKTLIDSISFRDKTMGWKNYSVEYSFLNGIKKRTYASDDLYMRCMMQNFSLRDSCFNCHFKGKVTQSDITLGDFWNIDQIESKENDDRGCSLVLLQTTKGKQLFEQIRGCCHSFPASYNSLNLEESMRFLSTPINKKRDEFLREVMVESTTAAMKKYCDEGIHLKVKKHMWRVLKRIGVK